MLVIVQRRKVTALSDDNQKVLDSDSQFELDFTITNQSEIRRPARVLKPNVFDDFVTYQVTAVVLHDPKSVSRYNGKLW